jgi:hypothetical protein
VEVLGIEGMLENSKGKLPLGIEGISIVMVFSGIFYIAVGISWLIGALDPAALLFSLLAAVLFLGGGILMIKVGRELVRLKLWALWGACIMFIVTLLIVVINPFAALQVLDNPFGRGVGAVACVIIICYLVTPAVRSRFVL